MVRTYWLVPGFNEASGNLDLPMLATIKQRLEEAAEEHGDKDMAASYLASAPRLPSGQT